MNKNLSLCLALLFAFSLEAQELIILGTAQDAGKPQLGCEKACCQEGSERGMVVSLGFFLENKQWYLFEATPDITEQIASIPEGYKSKPTAVYLSHAHIGHYTGLMYFGREAANMKTIPVFCGEKMERFLQENGPWSQLVDLHNIGLISFPALDTVSEEKIAGHKGMVIALRVPHRDEFSETLGFIIYGEEKTALFIPDIDKWEKWKMDINELIKLVDYAFLDATFYDGNELPGRDMSTIPHPFVIESMARFDSLSAEDRNKIYFIHLNHTNPLWDPQSSESQEVQRRGYHVARLGQKFQL